MVIILLYQFCDTIPNKRNKKMKTLKLLLLIITFISINGAMAQEKKDLSINSSKSVHKLGGIASEGTLQVFIYDNANMQVNRYISGSWIKQWYGNSSKSIWLFANGETFSGDGSYFVGASNVFTTISNTNVDANTNELILEKNETLRIKQTTYYPAGSTIIYYTWEITNISGTTINDLRFFSGGDTYLQGDDYGAGLYFSNENIVGVKKTIAGNLQKLDMQGITMPYAFESQNYYAVYQNIIANALTNIIDENEETDNGMALEYRTPSLASGKTWTIQALEKFNANLLPNIVVTAPPSEQIVPDSTINLDFTIQNRTSSPTTVNLSASIDISGWSVSIISPSSPYFLPANSIQTVNLSISCPIGTALGTTAKITLNATDLIGSASDYCNVTAAAVPTISAHPYDINICANSLAIFAISATNATTYQWQEYDTIWKTLTDSEIYNGTTTSTLSIATAAATMNNFLYRCFVANDYGNATSNNAHLTIFSSPSIISQPMSSSVCEGENTSFAINANGTAINYQWQINEGSGFINITNNNVYSGAFSNILNIASATSIMNDYAYRCKVSGVCNPSAFSDAASLSIYNNPDVKLGNDTILSENQSITLDAGAGSNFIWSNPSLNGRIVTIDFALLGLGTHEISVTVTNSNNCVDIDTIEITFNALTGTNTFTQTSFISIQPNPTSGIVSIFFPSVVKDAEIEIYNMQGKMILSKKTNNVVNIQIDISYMNKGVYTVKITTNNQIVNKKLILNN
ncbi:MAG: hypothetical protein AUJ97_04280 [Bacteroidetes bacterium CG2_30_32_10]|nr:MAG: hypothetical protein AUJ97_04280 [Bacteroidetes bacterium CG2_30_32_10]